MPRGPDSQHDAADGFAHRALDHRAEVVFQGGGLRNDVERAEEGRGDVPQLLDVPLGADAPAVAFEAAGACLEGGLERLPTLALVSTIREQDRMPDRGRPVRE